MADAQAGIYGLVLFIAMTVFLLLQRGWTAYSQVETIPCSQFQQMVNDGKVATMACRLGLFLGVDNRGDLI